MSTRVVDSKLKPLGYAQDGTITAASPLPSIPTGAEFALIMCTGQAIRWTDDGTTTPTGTVGMLLPVNTNFWYTGTLSAFSCIESAATAVLNVSYYREREASDLG